MAWETADLTASRSDPIRSCLRPRRSLATAVFYRIAPRQVQVVYSRPAFILVTS